MDKGREQREGGEGVAKRKWDGAGRGTGSERERGRDEKGRREGLAETRKREGERAAASPVRGPGPPASGSSSSARAASPGMAWPYARPSVPCLSVSPSGGACAATAPRPGGERGQWVTSAPPRPPSAPSELVSLRGRARHCGVPGAQGVGQPPSLPPHTPPRLHSSPAVRGPAFPAASQPLGSLLPSTNGRGVQGQSEVSPISRVGKRQKVVRIRGAGPGRVLGILGDRRFAGGGATGPLLEHPAPSCLGRGPHPSPVPPSKR